MLIGNRKRKKTKRLLDFVEKLLEFKDLPGNVIENIEQDSKIPPLTIETIQLVFDGEKIEEIFDKLNEHKNELEKIREHLIKIYKEIEEKYQKLIDIILPRIIPATSIEDPMNVLKGHLEFWGSRRGLKIPEIEKLKTNFKSDKYYIDKIIRSIQSSKAESRPTVIIIKGASGSGKTTFICNLVKEIEKEKNWAVVVMNRDEKFREIDILKSSENIEKT